VVRRIEKGGPYLENTGVDWKHTSYKQTLKHRRFNRQNVVPHLNGLFLALQVKVTDRRPCHAAFKENHISKSARADSGGWCSLRNEPRGTFQLVTWAPTTWEKFQPSVLQSRYLAFECPSCVKCALKTQGPGRGVQRYQGFVRLLALLIWLAVVELTKRRGLNERHLLWPVVAFAL